MKGKTRIWIAMALLFASGVAVGFFGSGLLLRHRVSEFVGRGPSGMHARVVHRVMRDLDLTPGQRDEIDRILDETEPILREHAERFGDTMERTLDEQHDRIKAVLDEGQREIFDRRMEELQRRFEQMRDRRRPPRGHRGDPPPHDHR